MDSIIHTEGLTKSYGPNRGIIGVDLDVYPGEVFGFLGPNGAGKTTLIRTLLNLLHPTDGRAEVFGLDSRSETVKIRTRIGNLPDEFGVEGRDTGADLIRFYARLRGVEDLSYAWDLAETLDADLRRPVRELSTGNRRKIGLVQAMFHRPPLLILDEPSSGLDPLVREEFLGIVRGVRDEGRTVFFSSHVLSEVERVCDRVGIIREGRLVAVEPTSELLEKRFRRVRVRFADAVDYRRLEAVPGVGDVSTDGGAITLTFEGEMDALVKELAQHEVADLDIEHPSLEETFLAYYGGES